VTPRNTILIGDARSVLSGLAPGSVDCAITSPPYFGVRDYGVVGQLGMETSIDGWVDALRQACNELARVLVPSGSLWLNLADSYARHERDGALPKSLLLGPERLVQALLADGWIVRNRVAWIKPNSLPTSAADRLMPRWEFVYHLVRARQYFYDLDAIRVPLSRPCVPARRSVADDCAMHGRLGDRRHGLAKMKLSGQAGHPLGKNPGDAWQVTGSRLRGHRATFPTELIRRPLLATCPERVCSACGQPWRRDRHPVRFQDGRPQPRSLVPCACGAPTRPGLVLDPFMGSGTTAIVARRLSRDWLGIELNPRYVALAHDRIRSATGASSGRGRGTTTTERQ
jgi:DNA modification methylase